MRYSCFTFGLLLSISLSAQWEAVFAPIEVEGTLMEHSRFFTIADQCAYALFEEPPGSYSWEKDNYIFRSCDNWQSYETVFSFDNGPDFMNYVNIFHAVTDSVIIMAGFNGYISYDGGISWERFSSDRFQYGNIHFLNDKVGGLVGNHFYSTTDGFQQSWIINTALGYKPHFVGSSTIYSSTYGWTFCDPVSSCPTIYGRGFVFKSTDEGGSFDLVLDTPYALTDISFVSPSTGFGIAHRLINSEFRFFLFSTTDGAETWEIEEIFDVYGEPLRAIEIVAFDEQHILLGVPGSYYLHRSLDGGRTWKRYDTAWHLNFVKGPYFYSHSGKRLDTRSLDSLTPSALVNNSALDVNLFPSPASTHLQIALPASLQKKEVQFHLINTTGETVIKKNVSDGESVDIANLPKGMYIVQVISDDRVLAIKRVMKL